MTRGDLFSRWHTPLIYGYTAIQISGISTHTCNSHTAPHLKINALDTSSEDHFEPKAGPKFPNACRAKRHSSAVRAGLDVSNARLPRPQRQGAKYLELSLVAVDPPAKSLTFWGLVKNTFISQKLKSKDPTQ